MSYRCETCQAVIPPGTPMCRHVVYRTALRGPHALAQSSVREIARELAVCAKCGDALAAGAAPKDLTRYRATRRPSVTPSQLKPLPEESAARAATVAADGESVLVD